MASYCQGAKRAEEPAVMQRNQAERDDDKKNRLLVDMPAEKEGRVAAERDCADERFPSRFIEQSK